MITRYLLAILFILLASSRHLVNRFIDMMRQYEMDEFTAEIIYSVGLVIVFSLFYYVISCARAPHSHSYQENFFFQVSENKTLGRNHPRDAITNANKSVSFQYDVPDGSGMCSGSSCNDYGLIKGCPGKKHAFGESDPNQYM
jgi:hypothetical protein